MFEMRDYNGVRTMRHADYGQVVKDIENAQLTAEQKQEAIEKVFEANGAVEGWLARMDHMYDKED